MGRGTRSKLALVGERQIHSLASAVHASSWAAAGREWRPEPAVPASSKGRCEGWDSFTVPRFARLRHFHGPVLVEQLWKGTMPLGKRWLGCMLIGVGLLMFGVSRQHWQEWVGFAIIAAGIVLVLTKRITGSPIP